MSKRVLIIIGIIVVIVLGVSGFAVAYALSQSDQQSTASATPTATSTPNPANTGTGQGNRQTSLYGLIQSLNNQTFVIATLHGNRMVTVSVNPSTRYASLEGQGTFNDLKVGQAVNVVGQINTQNQTITAVRVILLPPLGQLTAINGQSLTLMTFDSKIVQVQTNSSTLVYVPLGLRSVAISAKVIKVGQILGYEGTTGNASISAARLWLFGLPQFRGTVTAINGKTLTVHTLAGANMTVTLTPNTTYIQGPVQKTPVSSNLQALQVGGTVAVMADGRPASGTAAAVLVVVVTS
jgi:riboflavin synthase alpha subunit